MQSDPLTRRGEVEGVHGMRVATRRMRSALKEARRQLEPSWVEETRSELKWLGSLLGDVRDADVFAAYVQGEVASLGAQAAQGGVDLVGLITAGSQPARARLAEALDSPRYLALLDRLEATRESLPVTSSRDSTERMLRRAARRTRRKLRGVSRSSSDTRLHKLRIASKRARYAAELATPAQGRPARRVAKRAEALQTILGEHQDAVVAERSPAEPCRRRDAGRSVRCRPSRRAPARSPEGGACPAARRGEALRQGHGRSLAVHRIVTGS